MEPVNKGLTSVKPKIRNDAARVRSVQAALVDDFRSLIDDAEQLVNSLGDASTESLAGARDRLVARLEDAKAACSQTERALRLRVEDAAEAATTYVSEHPVRAVAIAAAAGLVIGCLLQRR